MNAAFFDMDGTLIDSRADLVATVNDTRRDFGLAEIPADEVMAHVGNGMKALLKGSIPELAARVEEVLPVHRANYEKEMLVHVSLYPGVARTLRDLADRGWGLGIVTNKPSFATREILKHLGIAHYFGNAIVCPEDCAEMKPSALPIRLAAERMRGHRLSSKDWMVGDNWTDLQAASNAGIRGAFCSYGYGVVGDSRVSARINSFADLLRLCKEEE